MLSHHEAASGGGKKPFSYINVSSLSIALSFQQLSTASALSCSTGSTDSLYLQPVLPRMPLASAGITHAAHRQKADNFAHPHCLLLPSSPYPEKGKNTLLETTLCFVQLQPSIFALSLRYSLFLLLFFPFNPPSNWFCNVRDDDS